MIYNVCGDIHVTILQQREMLKAKKKRKFTFNTIKYDECSSPSVLVYKLSSQALEWFRTSTPDVALHLGSFIRNV